MAQFVPVKLDIASKEYAQWRQDHAHEGSTIPILFIVRADGETLYGKSGSLNGDALPEMLVKALQHSGRIIDAKQAGALAEAAKDYQFLMASGEATKAVKAINRVSRIGVPGRITSFAESASRVNQLANQTAQDTVDRLSKLSEILQEDDAEKQLSAILESMQLRRELGALKILKADLAKFSKELGKQKELSQLVSEAKIIAAGMAATSKSSRARALTKLRELVESTDIPPVKTTAEKLIAELQQ